MPSDSVRDSTASEALPQPFVFIHAPLNSRDTILTARIEESANEAQEFDPSTATSLVQTAELLIPKTVHESLRRVVGSC